MGMRACVCLCMVLSSYTLGTPHFILVVPGIRLAHLPAILRAGVRVEGEVAGGPLVVTPHGSMGRNMAY